MYESCESRLKPKLTRNLLPIAPRGNYFYRRLHLFKLFDIQYFNDDPKNKTRIMIQFYESMFRQTLRHLFGENQLKFFVLHVANYFNRYTPSKLTNWLHVYPMVWSV